VSERTHQCNFRLTDVERDRFFRVAEHYGIPVAAMLRMLVKERADLLAEKGETPAPKKRSKTKA
jgi:hypothetical protein